MSFLQIVKIFLQYQMLSCKKQTKEVVVKQVDEALCNAF